MNFDITSTITSGESMMRLWETLSRIPGGKRVFSKTIGRMAPYTGTIDARVRALRPGYCRVQMRDRRAVRNHLSSVHAIALMNLAEVATGLALLSGMPAGGRGILKGLSIEYHKKARGLLTAECETDPPATIDRHERAVVGRIRNREGVVVATATAHWLVGPAKR